MDIWNIIYGSWEMIVTLILWSKQKKVILILFWVIVKLVYVLMICGVE